MRATPSFSNHKPARFLPNLCQARPLLLLLLGAGLLAVMLALAKDGLTAFSLEHLAFLMLQTQWIALICAFVLNQSDKYLSTFTPALAGSAALAICLGVAAMINSFGQLLMGVMDTNAFNLAALLETLIMTALISGSGLRYLYLQQQLQVQREAELHSRIQALQSRIHPHFLFNSMNSIASLIAMDPIKAENAVLDLASLFRASLAEPTLIPLRQEIASCRHYLAIEALRLDTRLNVEWDVDDAALGILVPNLSLQPLIENAIVHGIETCPEGGKLFISIALTPKGLRATIRNPHIQSLTLAHESQREKSNGIALQNIRNRLTSLFGNDARLTTSFDQQVFTTSLFIPRVTAPENT